MSIDKELEAKILRYHYVEKWKVGTISRQLNIHHDTVERVLSQAGMPKIERACRPSLIESYLPFVMATLKQYPRLTGVLFLYNTGARAQEVADLVIADLTLKGSPSVRIVGKGGKVRHCPLWTSTAEALNVLVANRQAHEPVFLNRRQQPLTRFGISALIKRLAKQASQKMPSLCEKAVSAHTIRHTTAVHLLRAGVDINTIRAWLGHVSLDTTNIYAEIDLEMKAEALAHCEVPAASSTGRWRKNPDLMAFLKAL